MFVIYERDIYARKYLEIIKIHLDNLSMLEHSNNESICIQQDDVPAYNAVIVRKFLKQTIGPRRGAVL